MAEIRLSAARPGLSMEHTDSSGDANAVAVPRAGGSSRLPGLVEGARMALQICALPLIMLVNLSTTLAHLPDTL